MANRGIAVVNDIGSFQEQGVVTVKFTYIGFTNGDEIAGAFTATLTPSDITGAQIKAAVKDVLVVWYNQNHEAGNFDDWDILDTFVLVGGIV